MIRLCAPRIARIGVKFKNHIGYVPVRCYEIFIMPFLPINPRPITHLLTFERWFEGMVSALAQRLLFDTPHF